MPRQSKDTIAVLGIGKNTFHLIGLSKRGVIVLRQKLSRGQLEAKLANLPPCLVGMECVGAHQPSRRLKALGHDTRLMPAKYVKAFLKGNKNDFRDAEAIAEAVQRPTMRFVATKTAEQLDLQALHRVRLRLVTLFVPLSPPMRHHRSAPEIAVRGGGGVACRTDGVIRAGGGRNRHGLHRHLASRGNELEPTMPVEMIGWIAPRVSS